MKIRQSGKHADNRPVLAWITTIKGMMSNFSKEIDITGMEAGSNGPLLEIVVARLRSIDGGLTCLREKIELDMSKQIWDASRTEQAKYHIVPDLGKLMRLLERNRSRTV